MPGHGDSVRVAAAPTPHNTCVQSCAPTTCAPLKGTAQRAAAYGEESEEPSMGPHSPRPSPAPQAAQGARQGLLRTRATVLCLVCFSVTAAEGHPGFLGRNEGLKTKRELRVNEPRPPGPAQEFEVLLQVPYRDTPEKELLRRRLLELPLATPSACFPGPSRILGAKATTYCRSQDGAVRCACEDTYTWFPASCLDPQHCHLNATGSRPSCDCGPSNLSQSVSFCERAKVWGTFKIKETFTNELLNPSSAKYSQYASKSEKQLEEVYKRIQDFESVHVTQFRAGSIIVGFEVIGSSSTSQLLAALQQESAAAQAALSKLFPLEAGSFRVFSKASCHSVAFGFGAEDSEFTLPCGRGYAGNVTARCRSSGWQVVQESCVLSQLQELLQNFSAIAGNATQADVSALVRELSGILQQSQSITAGNLASVVSLLSSVSALSLEKGFSVSDSTLEDVISIADHILNSSSITNWTILLQEEEQASSQLLQTLENIALLVPPSALPLNFSLEFINWQGIPWTQTQGNRSYSYQIEMFQEDHPLPVRGHVFIRPDQFQVSAPKTIVSMASVTFGYILPKTQGDNARVNGPLISTAVQNYSINEIFVGFSKIDTNLSRPHCVFWSFSHSRWSSAGCHLVNETPDTVLCRCTHLTSFSVLMSPSVPAVIVPAVRWVTYVGLAISVGSLVLGLTVEALSWKQLRNTQISHTRHICMVNVALSLLIADVWFIVAVTVDTSAGPSGVCIAAIFFTHFFYLSLFFWMLVLGVLLSYRIVFVFHHMAMPSMMAIGFCLGYGCPLVIAVITVAVTQPSNSYSRKDVCWLNWSDGSKPLLAFAVPALTIVAVNLVAVLLVLSKLWRPAIRERVTQNDKATIIRVGKSLLVLAPLLGLTWGFGIGTMVDSQNPAWHVVFALFNAIQGFFIFCFGILLDNKLRRLLISKLSPLSRWKQTQKQNPSDVLAKPKYVNSFQPLKDKGKYTLSHTGDSASNITLTQFLSTE
ncbi:adhesion G-protein coupled receptor F1 isoform X1 [Fukomys damarensis]|uniref:adhesion G-protein coupled receptor F1 isoform X1 n=2 Tax=Fukomys damarensis TaxID=885580 RepID=UPI00053F4CB2|nr:adhesion G-protein coupled receptor F1 isoform X1 [Fukomys damarensis]XP_010616079.1 adhesion G-protein coupled receptor F1 isoform X1 [Fukomys damarensis]